MTKTTRLSEQAQVSLELDAVTTATLREVALRERKSFRSYVREHAEPMLRALADEQRAGTRPAAEPIEGS